jgi:hypothetical protein
VLGRRAADCDEEEEDYGNQQQPTRRKLFSKLSLDRAKSKDREDHEIPLKEGVHELGSANQFGGETQEGCGFGDLPPSLGLSFGSFFNRSGGGGKGAVPPLLPYSLLASRIRQVTCCGGFLKSRGRLLARIIIISTKSAF